jgi:hypothetical protein
MNWRVILAAFGVIFLAELGDKTRLAAMTLAAQPRRPWGAHRRVYRPGLRIDHRRRGRRHTRLISAAGLD